MQNNRSWIDIDLSAFEFNINRLKEFLPENVQIMQIVKADAYGHGAFEIAKKAIECGINFFGVANADEGALLRFQGITKPILILSPSFIDEIPVIIENNLIPTISEINFATELNKQADSQIPVQVNIDTGMGRSGISCEQYLSFLVELKDLNQIKIEGIFSHYSSSEKDVEFSNMQTQKFQKIVNNPCFKPKFIHIANSSAVITCSDAVSNLVRVGLLSYGIYSDDAVKAKIKLKPVMSFKTRISQIKTAEKGDPIGYNRTYIAPRKTKYAVLPVGYADGLDFKLSGKGKVMVQNTICNIIGKISMDMTTVDVSEIPKVGINDEVEIIGSAHKDINAENQVKLYKGSGYELSCRIGRRAKRYYYDCDKLVSSSPPLRRDFFTKDHSDDRLTSIIDSAMEQRLQSKDISNMISEHILNRIFAEKDNNIFYRKNFQHIIEFSGIHIFDEYPKQEFYVTNTILTYNKVLQNNHFHIACAGSEEKLEKYFMRNDVEYRWLLDKVPNLNEKFFKITSVKVNDMVMHFTTKIIDGNIEIKCFHRNLSELVGKEVKFSICTQTFYPKNSNQLSVYITEITQGINIKFIHNLKKIEIVPIFSGQTKFPKLKIEKNAVTVASEKNEWIFPNSGVVFVYRN